MKIGEYEQMMAYLTRPIAQESDRANLAIGGEVIEGEDLGTREGFKNPGINVHAKRLSKVKNYLDQETFAKLRIENKDKTNQEFADFLNKKGYKPDPKQADKFSGVTVDRRYNAAKQKGLIPKDFVYAGSAAEKAVKPEEIKEYKNYIKENFPKKYKDVLQLSEEQLKTRVKERRSYLKKIEKPGFIEAKNIKAQQYRYETSRGLRGEEAQKKYQEYVAQQNRERRKNLNKYYRNPRDPKSLLWEDLLKRNEQALDKFFSYDKKIPIKRYLDKDETQKIVLTDKQGNKYKYDTLLDDITKAQGIPGDEVLKPYAQKSFLYQENLMPEINKQFGIKPGARDNPFHIQHIEGFQQNPFNVQLTFGDQNLAEARGKLSLQSTLKNILKKEQKSPTYQKGTLYNYNKKKKAIQKFYNSLGPDIATKIGKKEVGNRTALVDLLDKTKVKIKPDVKERAMTLGAMGDVEMAKDILSKDFQTAKKLFGKYAPQIARGARQVTKFAVLPELAFGAAFAPLDLAEGRTGKETLLNVATLGMGIPIKDARDRANYVDQFGLKNDLFSAQMKATGLSQARGYGSGDPTSFELTDREKLALEKASEYDTNVLAPRLEEKLQERRAASDPEFGFREGAMNGGIMRLGFADGPPDPSKRKFMKIMGGLASLPILGRFIKPAAKVAPAALEAAKGMPEWFGSLVDKVIKEGIDVTKRFATKDREVVHVKQLGEAEGVRVTQDLETGAVRVDYDSPTNMGEQSVSFTYRPATQLEEGKTVPAQFEAIEAEPRGIRMGPDDYDIEFDGENLVESADELMSDTSSLKQFATGKLDETDLKIRKEKLKKVQDLNQNQVSQAEYLETKYGPGDDLNYQDFSDYD